MTTVAAAGGAPIRIAVVGGGAAAVSLLDSMLTRADQIGADVNLTVYEPAPLAHGYAFGPDLECARINLPNTAMSVRDDDRAHFARWLHRRPGTAGLPTEMTTDDGFAPRHLFGRYLADHFDTCRAEAATRGWQVDVRTQAVIDIMTDDGEATVVTTRSRHRHSHVVLCLGPGSPADPFRLTGAPDFHPDPYPLRTTLPAVNPRRDVLVVGTGLTAVDTVLGLLHLGHQGRITMASRRGILPGVLTPSWPHPLRHVTAATVDALANVPAADRPARILHLLHAELASAGLDPLEQTAWLRSGASATEHLRHQLTHPAVNPMQAVFMGVSRPLAAAVRAALPATDRRRLLRELRPHLKSLQCPMPPLTARRLLGAVDAGQLQVAAGLSDVRRGHGHFEATTIAGPVRARHVIDATRTTPAATTGRARPLLAALTARRYATFDDHGGLRTDPVTGWLHGSRRLFAIGEITAGDVYYGSSLPAVNRGADTVARTLADERAESSMAVSIGRGEGRR